MALPRLAAQRCCSLRGLLDLVKQQMHASQLVVMPPSLQGPTWASQVQPISALSSSLPSPGSLIFPIRYSTAATERPDPLIERAASNKGASTSSSMGSDSADRPTSSSLGGGQRAEQQPGQIPEPRPRFPFGGKRQPPSPRPHAGGPTPDQVSAQLGPPQVTRLGKVTGPYRVPRKAVFAVVELGPTQFKVCSGPSCHLP